MTKLTGVLSQYGDKDNQIRQQDWVEDKSWRDKERKACAEERKQDRENERRHNNDAAWHTKRMTNKATLQNESLMNNIMLVIAGNQTSTPSPVSSTQTASATATWTQY